MIKIRTIKLNKITIELKVELIDLIDTHYVPTNVHGSRPGGFELRHKQKESQTFLSLKYDESLFLEDNLFDLLRFIEVLKSFSGNRLTMNKTYQVLPLYAFKGIFLEKVSEKDPTITNLIIANNDERMQLDKYESQVLASQLQKIAHSCDISYDHEQLID